MELALVNVTLDFRAKIFHLRVGPTAVLPWLSKTATLHRSEAIAR